jgi:hypothetical protein
LATSTICSILLTGGNGVGKKPMLLDVLEWHEDVEMWGSGGQYWYCSTDDEYQHMQKGAPMAHRNVTRSTSDRAQGTITAQKESERRVPRNPPPAATTTPAFTAPEQRKTVPVEVIEEIPVKDIEPESRDEALAVPAVGVLQFVNHTLGESRFGTQAEYAEKGWMDEGFVPAGTP